MFPRVGWRVISLGLLAITGCQMWVGDYVADREDPVDTNHLCALELSKDAPFYIELDLDSGARHDTLEAYYLEANPGLAARFDDVTSDFMNATATRSATYVVGEAGLGKSFLMGRLATTFADSDTCEVDLAKAVSAPSDRLPTRLAPDLTTTNGDVVLNELPGFANPDAFSLATFLEEQSCVQGDHVIPLILLDGIDEIHPASARVLLREVEDYLLATSRAFVHLVISGRPEGFTPWFSDPARDETTGRVTRTFQLETPVYSTKGDIEFRLREYLAFSMQLDALDKAGEFDDYAASVVGALEEYPFLRYTLGNLAVGNVVLQHTAPGSDESEVTLKQKIFDDMVVRNVGTHNRPGSGSRYDRSYLEVLEHIAATHVDINDKGEFIVSPSEEVSLLDAAGKYLGEVPVIAVLERSGLAYSSSPSSTTKRFKFSPFWIHGYLVERYNQRATPKYSRRSCY